MGGDVIPPQGGSPADASYADGMTLSTKLEYPLLAEHGHDASHTMMMPIMISMAMAYNM